MRCAIMQPYFFPYIGYFQLIHAVDKFIFYDDVSFNNRGWINRNNFLINGQKQLISIPCDGASQNRLINEIDVKIDPKFIEKTLKKIRYSYARAPYFDVVFPLFERCLEFHDGNLARFSANSVMLVCDFLGLNKKFIFSSEEHHESRNQDKADRLIEISKKEKCTDYINPIGGKELYDKAYFSQHGINLYFTQPGNITYLQFSETFIPWLSIVDLLMFNSVDDTKKQLDNFELI